MHDRRLWRMKGVRKGRKQEVHKRMCERSERLCFRVDVYVSNLSYSAKQKSISEWMCFFVLYMKRFELERREPERVFDSCYCFFVGVVV